MKVLWFSNILISENISNSGTWIFTMANVISEQENVELFNITEGIVDKITVNKHGKIVQWVLPTMHLKNGLPNESLLFEIQKIVEYVNPDIIHIWGTENYWGLLYTRGYLKGRVLLDIQGLKHVCYEYFYTGMTFYDLINSIAFKDIFRPKYSLFGKAKSFKEWGKYELEIIKNFQNIGVQSSWVNSYIRLINPDANIYKSKIQLRKQFTNGKNWNYVNCEPYRLFASASNMISYKGIHLLIDALTLLKVKYPKLQLHIAGSVSHKGIRQNGYDRFLFKKIKKYNLENNVKWLGPLNADFLVEELLNSNICIIPSFIESYCVAFDEALSLGVPTIASYSGAMPELAIDEYSALYYSPLDKIGLASKIEKYFDPTYSQRISNNILESKIEKPVIDHTQAQMSIYNQVINNT